MKSSQRVLRRFLSPFISFLCALLLPSCASDRHFRAARAGDPSPRFIELQEEQSISTIHFLPGLYSLDSVDDTGYYYRAPRPLRQHSFAGSLPQEGGIFVDKTNQKVRGYIVWAAGLTKIGNLSHARYRFRD